jgi:hypothetical protein
LFSSSAPAEFQDSLTQNDLDYVGQAFNASPTYDDFAQMESFQELGIPGADLLVGFMSEDMLFADFSRDKPNSR